MLPLQNAWPQRNLNPSPDFIHSVIIFTVGRLVSVARAGKALDEDITCKSSCSILAKSILYEQLTVSGAFITPIYWFICEISVASIGISLPSIFRLVKRATCHGPAALLNDKEYPTDTSRSRETEKAVGGGGFVRLRNSTKNGRKNGREREIHLNNLELGNR